MCPLAVTSFFLTHKEEKGKAAMMLKPSAKRKRSAVELVMEEEKGEKVDGALQYQGEIKRL